MSVFDTTDTYTSPEIILGVAEENYKKIDQFVRDNIPAMSMADAWRARTYEGRGTKIEQLEALYEAAISVKNEILTNHIATLKELNRVSSERDFYKRSYEMLVSSLGKEMMNF